ncbi:MAG: type I secretion system permease/ATPase [Oleiphilaceae bacterium]|nr:type I secretion system permease/ATPase [Oleiphilaceae bacterium]
MPAQSLKRNPVDTALQNVKRSVRGVFLFSFVVNLLLLTSPMFMLQVYDRVLLSRSESTLLGLIGIAVFLLLLLLAFEIIRNFLLNRISVRFDQELGPVVFEQVFRSANSSQPMHDMNTVRNFIANPYLLALFDIPWLPAYLLVVYLLHPALGHVGLIGAILLFSLALINDRSTRAMTQASNEAFGAAGSFVEHGLRNKGAALGMGMLPALLAQWRQLQVAGIGFQALSTERNAWIGAIAKVLRQLIQIAVLATGAYLAIQDITSAGVMIAASIIIGRALTPIEQSIQGWRAWTKARESAQDLHSFMDQYHSLQACTPLPVPLGGVAVSNALVLADDEQSGETKRPLLKNVSLQIKAGESIGVTGPSGSGKTTLARMMLGLVKTTAGSVRIDGAELTPETQAQLSAYFGYLPQDVELFDGTVAENIARFKGEAGEQVVEAAMMAGAHELILSLPQGYETKVGPSGLPISGGQKQRIGLARALFGKPSLIVLDEPSSNLDQAGSQAVLNVLKAIKQQGITCIVIAHQPGLFGTMDKIAVIAEGMILKFGEREQILAELNPKRPVSASDKQKQSTAPVTRAVVGGTRIVPAKPRVEISSSEKKA